MIGEISIAKSIGDSGQPCLIPDVGKISEERQTPPLITKAIGLLNRASSRETSSGGRASSVKKDEANWCVTES